MSKLVNLERKLYLHYRPGVVSDLDRHLGPCAIRGAPDGIPCHIGESTSYFLLDGFYSAEIHPLFVRSDIVSLSHVEIVARHQRCAFLPNQV